MQIPPIGDQFGVLPFNSGVKSRVYTSYAALRESGANITWLPDDTSLWVTAHDMPLTNIWWVTGSSSCTLLLVRCPLHPPPGTRAAGCAPGPRTYPCARSRCQNWGFSLCLPAFIPLPCCRWFASKMMPLYLARKLNATQSLGMDLPPMKQKDILFFPYPAE